MKYTFVCYYTHGPIPVVKKLRFLGFSHRRVKAPKTWYLGYRVLMCLHSVLVTLIHVYDIKTLCWLLARIFLELWWY